MPHSEHVAGFVLPMPEYSAHRKMAKFVGRITPETRVSGTARFLDALQKNYGFYQSTPGYAPKQAAVSSDDDRLTRFARRGIAAYRLPDTVKAQVRADLKPLIAELAAAIEEKEPSARKFRDLNRQIERKRFPGVFEGLAGWVGQSGVLAMFEAYVGARLQVSTLALQKNDDITARSHYGEIGRDGLPANKTSYMHIDSSIWPTVKILIYLTDVETTTGPFHYCLGSHLLPSLFEFMVRKTNDGLKLPAEEFLALPDEFRQHTLFGEFVDGSDPVSADLLSREWPVVSQDGDVICFDNNGVHRGGFVQSGHRLMLQMNFVAA